MTTTQHNYHPALPFISPTLLSSRVNKPFVAASRVTASAYCVANAFFDSAQTGAEHAIYAQTMQNQQRASSFAANAPQRRLTRVYSFVNLNANVQAELSASLPAKTSASAIPRLPSLYDVCRFDQAYERERLRTARVARPTKQQAPHRDEFMAQYAHESRLRYIYSQKYTSKESEIESILGVGADRF